MNDNLLIKIEDLCIAVDNYLEKLYENIELYISAIYDYLHQDITIIYPNTFVQTYNDYINFFNRLKDTLNKVAILPDKCIYIIDYFRKILFDIDLSVIR